MSSFRGFDLASYVDLCEKIERLERETGDCLGTAMTGVEIQELKRKSDLLNELQAKLEVQTHGWKACVIDP